MKRILLQLDTEEHPSPFDAIVAHDADVDVLLSHGNVKREDARALAQDAFFTRGPDDLKNTAIWVGGKHVAAGEEIFAEVQKAFFGPFKVSVDARLQRLQHDRGDDDRADRQELRPRRQAGGRARPRIRRAALRDPAAEGGLRGRRRPPAGRPVRRRPPLSPPPWPGRRREARPRPPRAEGSLRARGDARRRAGRPRRGTGRRGGAARGLLVRSTRASSCSPTTTRPIRSASRAPRRPTTSSTTTASSCSARWPSAGRR